MVWESWGYCGTAGTGGEAAGVRATVNRLRVAVEGDRQVKSMSLVQARCMVP